MKKLMLLAIPIAIVLGGCASTPYPKRFSHNRWYDDLNPASEDIKSDWELMDINKKTFSDRNDALTDMGHTIQNLVIE